MFLAKAIIQVKATTGIYSVIPKLKERHRAYYHHDYFYYSC